MWLHGDVRRLSHRRVARRVVVGVDLSPSSMPVLKHAARLASTLGSSIRVVHVLPPSAGSLERWSARLVASACAAEAGIELADDGVVLAEGEVFHALARASEDLDADLLVVGRSSQRERADVLVGALDSFRRPTLLVSRAHEIRAGVVAATDLRTPGAPVVAIAAMIAHALATSVTLLHNFEHDGRAGVPSVLRRLRQLERIANTFDGVHGARVTTEVRSDAILSVARATRADMIAVGARHGRGRTVASLLASAAVGSILVVPIGSPRMHFSS